MAGTAEQEILDKLTSVATGSPYGATYFQYYLKQAHTFTGRPSGITNTPVRLLLEGPSGTVNTPSRAPFEGPSLTGTTSTRAGLEETPFFEHRGPNYPTDKLPVFYLLTPKDLQIAVDNDTGAQEVLKYIFDLAESNERLQVTLINQGVEMEEKFNTFNDKMKAVSAAMTELLRANDLCMKEVREEVNRIKSSSRVKFVVPNCPEVLKSYTAQELERGFQTKEGVNKAATSFGVIGDPKGKGVIHHNQSTPTKSAGSAGKTVFWGDSAGDFLVEGHENHNLVLPLLLAPRNNKNEYAAATRPISPRKFLNFGATSSNTLITTGLSEQSKAQKNARQINTKSTDSKNIDSKDAQENFMKYMQISHLTKREYRGTHIPTMATSPTAKALAMFSASTMKSEHLQYSLDQLIASQAAGRDQGNPFFGLTDEDLHPVLRWKDAQKKKPFLYK